jgi:DNA mismatch endonuclease (patch repair protein)
MTDRLTASQRSGLMSRVRTKGTSLELTVRRALHRSGFRFRLHARELPGCPDIVLPRYRVAIFVHGCFWHGHNCRRGKLPETRPEFWRAKIAANVVRDEHAIARLTQSGWTPITIWQCTISEDVDAVLARLSELRSRALFLQRPPS